MAEEKKKEIFLSGKVSHIIIELFWAYAFKTNL